MSFLYIKGLHIIFIVTWFSGMFYLCRLFIYQQEATDRPDPERSILLTQFAVMTRRLLYAITLPSAVLTLISGITLLTYYQQVPGWLWLKLCFVTVLFFYHLSLHVIYNRHVRAIFPYSSQQLRIWNEVPTVLLVSIVMLVVVKEKASAGYGLIGLLLLIAALFISIKIYKAIRK